jgi:N-acetylmuramoyl-L-alanine amidase
MGCLKQMNGSRRTAGRMVVASVVCVVAVLGQMTVAAGQLVPPVDSWSTSAVPAPANAAKPRPKSTPVMVPNLSPPPNLPAGGAVTVALPGPADLDGLAAAAQAALRPTMPATSSESQTGRIRPVIVIDPGHGGVDPGAVSAGIAGQPPVLEKTVVLAVSKLLAAALLASGRYDVVLTRSGDTFVPLAERLNQSRRLSADLFISIHADSVATNIKAQGVRGATVYMLSDQASDEQARRLAEKENAADQAAGLPTAVALDTDQVRNILVDLMRRETAEFSAGFRSAVVAELGRRIAMARAPERAAAFVVLKQTDVPAVLIELGYMSNAQDQKLLQSAAWQSQVATSITAAIERYFGQRAVAVGRQ